MRPGCLAALSLLLLAATRAAAESPPELPPPPLVDVPPPEAPHLTRDPAVSIQVEPPFNRWPRIGVEAFTGAGLAVAGGIAASELGNSGWIFLGAPLGMTAGIIAGGALMDGNGSVMAVVGGELGGMLAGALIGAVFSATGPVPLYVAMSAMTLAGGVLMYELSSDDRSSEAEQALLSTKPPPVRVAPFVAPTGDGRGAMAGFTVRL